MMFPWGRLGILLATLEILQLSSRAGSCSEPQRFKTFTRELPREVAKGEAVRAMVSVGTLRRGEKIVVRTSSGEIAGSVSPFGIKPGQKAGIYPIPVPHNAIVG